MRETVSLWKFWMWEAILTFVIFATVVGGLLYVPELSTLVRGREIEAQTLSIPVVLAISILAYRFSTGTMVGFALWIVRLCGSALVVAFVTALPVFLLRPVLKPEYFDRTSPFVALFVLWCFYGAVFFVRWQTLLFYNLVNQLRARETGKGGGGGT